MHMQHVHVHVHVHVHAHVHAHLRPVMGPLTSSQTIFDRLCFTMPFSLANFSQRVSCLASGSGFSRGS